MIIKSYQKKEDVACLIAPFSTDVMLSRLDSYHSSFIERALAEQSKDT